MSLATVASGEAIALVDLDTVKNQAGALRHSGDCLRLPCCNPRGEENKRIGAAVRLTPQFV